MAEYGIWKFKAMRRESGDNFCVALEKENVFKLYMLVITTTEIKTNRKNKPKYITI